MTTIHDKLWQEVSAAIWATGEGMPYWQTENPDEVGVPLMEMIRNYKARLCNRSIMLAIQDKPRLSEIERLHMASQVVGEYVHQLCPVLLPEDKKAVLALLRRMLAKATQTIAPKARIEIGIHAISDN